MKLFKLKVDMINFKMICNMKDLDKYAKSYKFSNSGHVHLDEFWGSVQLNRPMSLYELI